ncbi:hypothetical protein L1049_000022 [Liquidambar formosana]|uniref:Uncharacterized protein n=1 Tax=Liquidambar formosana TaxID=63359 RepID=A0AAP0R2I8_LIQFO
MTQEVHMDGMAKGSPGPSACGGIFRSRRGFVKGVFCISLGVLFAIYAEIMSMIIAVPSAWDKGW